AAGSELFTGLQTERNKVAVLVTDGEPTDHDPASVSSKAKALRDQGVEVITVLVNSGEDRQQRAVKHTQMMAGLNDSSIEKGEGNWFTSNFANFADYMSSLIGGSDKRSLAEE